MANNLGIKGASGKFFGGIRAGHSTHADFRQGGGTFAPNTRFNEWSVKGNAGYTGKELHSRLSYEYGNQKLTFQIGKRHQKKSVCITFFLLTY
ncbi:MAG: hypothetical protein ACTTKO_08355 [Candidatus Limimorpha sp.]